LLKHSPSIFTAASVSRVSRVSGTVSTTIRALKSAESFEYTIGVGESKEIRYRRRKLGGYRRSTDPDNPRGVSDPVTVFRELK
jgi:hypothetical protein